MQEWNSPVWQFIGVAGMIAFPLLIVIVLLARTWVSSKNPRMAQIAVTLLAGLAGPRAARDALNAERSHHN
jgi:hypothetical protein